MGSVLGAAATGVGVMTGVIVTSLASESTRRTVVRIGFGVGALVGVTLVSSCILRSL